MSNSESMSYVSPFFDALKGRPVYDERDAETLNTSSGRHWFKPETKRFFGHRVSSTFYPCFDKRVSYFVTSEYTGFNKQGRAYSVRQINWDTGEVDTVGKFLSYWTHTGAHRKAKSLVIQPYANKVA